MAQHHQNQKKQFMDVAPSGNWKGKGRGFPLSEVPALLAQIDRLSLEAIYEALMCSQSRGPELGLGWRDERRVETHSLMQSSSICTQSTDSEPGGPWLAPGAGT